MSKIIKDRKNVKERDHENPEKITKEATLPGAPIGTRSRSGKAKDRKSRISRAMKSKIL